MTTKLPAHKEVLCRDSDDITAGQVSVLSLPLFGDSVTFRRLQSSDSATTRVITSYARPRPRLLGSSLVDEATNVAKTFSTTSTNTSGMALYDVAAATRSSAAITVATLTFGQAQLLLSEATALDDDILAISAVAVCGNGICELGERPNATAAGVNATGQEIVHSSLGSELCISWFCQLPAVVHLCSYRMHTRKDQLHAADQPLDTHLNICNWVIPWFKADSLCTAGGCPDDCYVPYVVCPIPTGSLSMCGGTPRGQCMTSSGQCTCSQGYSGLDCGKCASGYSREGLRCVLESKLPKLLAPAHCAVQRLPLHGLHSPMLP